MVDFSDLAQPHAASALHGLAHCHTQNVLCRRIPLLRHKLLLWHNMASNLPFTDLGMIGTMRSALQRVGMVGPTLSMLAVVVTRLQHPAGSLQLIQGSLHGGLP